MIRLAAVTFLLASTSAFAGDQSADHTHIGKYVIPGSSFEAPINYRPYGGNGPVRSRTYVEEDTKLIEFRQGRFSKKKTPVQKAAETSPDPLRSIVSVETFD